MIEEFKKKYWINKERKRIIKEFYSEKFEIDYFKSVRRTNMLRQEIGLKDMSIRKFKGIRKESKIHMSCSEKNCIYAMHYQIIELYKLSKIANENLITTQILKDFFEVIKKKYYSAVRIKDLKGLMIKKEIYKEIEKPKEEKKEEFKLEKPMILPSVK